MTGAERQRVTRLIDEAVRERLRAPAKGVKGHCKGCGIRFEDTPARMSEAGCWQCRDRIRRKAQRAREQADETLRRRRLEAQHKRRQRRRENGPFVGACSGCGCSYDQCTTGCKQCAARHARNRLHRQWVDA